MDYIKFWGATDTVTGSMHILHIDDLDICIDAGLFQGRRKDFYLINREFPLDVSRLNCLLLSHAHIDHSGNIPTMFKKWYEL